MPRDSQLVAVMREIGHETVRDLTAGTPPDISKQQWPYLPLELSEAVPLPWDASANCRITERGTGMLYTSYAV